MGNPPWSKGQSIGHGFVKFKDKPKLFKIHYKTNFLFLIFTITNQTKIKFLLLMIYLALRYYSKFI